MLRSLFTGISGLQAHQQMLDVTADNIANVNTNGFKASATTFEDTLSQTLQAATTSTSSGGSATIGGQNPNQIGLGVQLALTQANFAQGAPQSTGRKEDIMINGDGFLVTAKSGTTRYTRAGSLHLSTDSSVPSTTDTTNLVGPDGSIIQGYPTVAAATAAAAATPPTPPTNLQLTNLTNGTYSSWSISPDGEVTGINATTGAATTVGVIAMATFSNPEGLSAAGDTSYNATIASGSPQYGSPATANRGSLQSGALEMSNVNLATEFTNMIIAQRGFQANSRVITTSDQVLQTLVQMGQ